MIEGLMAYFFQVETWPKTSVPWVPWVPGSLALSVSSNFRMIPNRLGVRFKYGRALRCFSLFWSKTKPSEVTAGR